MSAEIYSIPVEKITASRPRWASSKARFCWWSTWLQSADLRRSTRGWRSFTSVSTGRGWWLPAFRPTISKRRSRARTTEIQTFCTANFGVKFPMFSKITVVGPEKHPLYTALIAAQPKAVSTVRDAVPRKAEGLWHRDAA